MPVFTVGGNVGRTLASVLNVPFIETSHQTGHILAGMIGSPPLKPPFVALHISGGTTESLLVRRGNGSVCSGRRWIFTPGSFWTGSAF